MLDRAVAWCRASARPALPGSWPATGPPRPPGTAGPAGIARGRRHRGPRGGWHGAAASRAIRAPWPARSTRATRPCRRARRHRPRRRVPAGAADPGPAAPDAVRGRRPGGLRAACRRHRRNATRIGLRDVGRDRASPRSWLGPASSSSRGSRSASMAPRTAPRSRRRADHRRPAVADRPHLPAARIGRSPATLLRAGGALVSEIAIGAVVGPAGLRAAQPHHRRPGRGGGRGGGAGSLGRAHDRCGGDRHRARAVCRPGPDRRHGLARLQPADRRSAGDDRHVERLAAAPDRPGTRASGRPPSTRCRRSRVSSCDTSSSAAARSRSSSIGRAIRRHRWPAR